MGKKFNSGGSGNIGSDRNVMNVITARNARRLEKKKKKWKPLYGWEGEVICEQRTIEEKPQLTYDKIKKTLEYFEKYGVNL